MKEHLVSLHKRHAEHNDRAAKLHKTCAAALDDADPHAAFHRAMAEEHGDMAHFHRKCAKAVDESDDGLPDVEGFDPSGRSKALVPADPRARKAAMIDDGLDAVAGAAPDNPNAAAALAKRGLRLAPRFGQPTLEETFEESVADLPPEIRKAIA